MTRRKVKLAWIVNDSARKASLRKRRASLVKKMSELTTLCDVNGFIIIYSPDTAEPVVWPERSVVEQLISRFQSIPDVERKKKMANQEVYLNEKITKIQEQIRKLKKKNNEMEMNDILYDIVQNGKPMHTFQSGELTGLVLFMRERMDEIRKRIQYMEESTTVEKELPPNAYFGTNFGGSNYGNVMGPQYYLSNVAGSSSLSLMPSNIDGITGNGMGLPPPGSVGGHDGENDAGLTPQRVRGLQIF